MTKQTETPPASGWMPDLNDKQLQNLVGATVDVFCGAKATTGLLTDIENGVARIFREDRDKPIEYQVAATHYQRVPGTPLRPALARALVHKREWTELTASLPDGESGLTAQRKQDSALADYEADLPEIHNDLLRELTTEILSPARKDTA